METSPDQPSKESPSSGGEPVDQAAIDALFSGPAPAAPDSPSATGQQDGTPASEAVDEVSQADIDALLTAAADGRGGDRPESPPPQQQETSGQPAADHRPSDAVSAAMQAATEQQTAAAAGDDTPSHAAADPRQVAAPLHMESYELPQLQTAKKPQVDVKRLTMLNDVNLRVKIELGRTRMLVEDVLKLGEGSVVELDKLAGDPVDVYVNERLVARGEVLVLNDSFCVRVSEVLSRDPHRITA